MSTSNAPRRQKPATVTVQEKWSGKLPWQDDASEAGRTIVRRHTKDLRDEAERIARRSGSGTVSPAFVQRAAEHINMHSPSGASDVLLGVGGLLLGIAGGFGAALLISPVAISTLLVVVAILVTVLGTALFTIGGTLKLKRR